MKADMKHTTAIPNEILLLGHQNYFDNTKNMPEIRKNNRKFSTLILIIKIDKIRASVDLCFWMRLFVHK